MPINISHNISAIDNIIAADMSPPKWASSEWTIGWYDYSANEFWLCTANQWSEIDLHWLPVRLRHIREIAGYGTD